MPLRPEANRDADRVRYARARGETKEGGAGSAASCEKAGRARKTGRAVQ